MESYNPKSTLVVKEHLIKKAKNIAFVDIHNHQWDMPNQDLKALLAGYEFPEHGGDDGEPERKEFRYFLHDDYGGRNNAPGRRLRIN